jgi:hypothetical protein
MAAPDQSPEQSRTIEMRLAEIENKLAQLSGQMQITDEEMRAYQKVSALLGGQAMGSQSAQLSPQVCQISRGVIPRSIVRHIFECTCGPCNPAFGGGFFGGGGFGSFGM